METTCLLNDSNRILELHLVGLRARTAITVKNVVRILEYCQVLVQRYNVTIVRDHVRLALIVAPSHRSWKLYRFTATHPPKVRACAVIEQVDERLRYSIAILVVTGH